MSVTPDTLLTQNHTEWPAFLTVPEVAAVIRVSKMTVYRMVHKHELEAIRAGRSFRVYRESLVGYLRDQAVLNEAA